MSKHRTRIAYRDAKTGEFITEAVAKRRPATTVKEVVELPAPKKGRKK